MYYSAKHVNKSIQKMSSSGGAFTALSDVILKKGGIVVGAGYRFDLNSVEHRICRTLEERNELRGSKYIQSDLKDTFRQIENEIKKNMEQSTYYPILFVGTPCQVDGLKQYLKIKEIFYEALFLCDIICHGVPSSSVWKTCLDHITRGKKIQRVTFKDKRKGWKRPLAFIEEGKKEKSLRPYTLLYFGGVIQRPSCSNCPYASLERVSDITIGDHWGVERCDKDFYDSNGVSLVITNSEKGEQLLKEASGDLILAERMEQDCLQPNLLHPAKMHPERDCFWRLYRNHTKVAIILFDGIVLFEKLRNKIISILKK